MMNGMICDTCHEEDSLMICYEDDWLCNVCFSKRLANDALRYPLMIAEEMQLDTKIKKGV